MAIFPCVKVSLSDTTVMIPDELMPRLQTLVCRQESPDSLIIEESELSSYRAALLQRMLESNFLSELVLDGTTFSNDSICLEHLVQGLECVQSSQEKMVANKGLTSLALYDLDVMKNPSFQAEQCRLFRSLGGLPNLKKLNMTLTCNPSDIPTAFANEVLLHPYCRIENLNLTWSEGGENNGDVDEISARFDDFFSAFQQNTSVSLITFGFMSNIICCADSTQTFVRHGSVTSKTLLAY
jgi:hypothetical protein